MAAQEQKVISAVAALIEARMESKMWLPVQNAFHDYMPKGPYYGADEERRVWEPVRDALRDLGARGGLQRVEPVRYDFKDLSIMLCARMALDSD